VSGPPGQGAAGPVPDGSGTRPRSAIDNVKGRGNSRVDRID